MQKNNKYRICIFSPLKNAYSETFIKNHLELLPFECFVINGQELFDLSFNDSFIYKKSLFKRVFFNRLFDSSKLAEAQLKEKIKGLKPDLVLFEYGHIGAQFFHLCDELNIPFVVHFHGNDASHKPTLDILKIQYKKMFVSAAMIVAVSYSMIDRLIILGAKKEKLRYIPYGADTNLFSIKKSSSNCNKKKLISVGRFVEKKAPFITILAYNNIAKKFPNSELVFIGEGQLLSACKQLVKALNLSNQVQFLGVLAPEEIADMLRQSYIYVQHSVIDEDGGAEGAPNSIIEASASGIPVVSTFHEGIPDIVENGVTGILVNEFDVQAMSMAIEKFLKNSDYRDEMAIAARKRIEINFNLQKQIDMLANLMIEIMCNNEK